MKLPDGVTVYVGGKRYKGECPDGVVPEKKKTETSKPKKAKDADK
jgi:hypothetical protein